MVFISLLTGIVLYVCIFPSEAIKCFLHGVRNKTDTGQGYWTYCASGCCHDKCCTPVPHYDTSATETLAMVSVGMFIVGTLCIVLSWTRLRRIAEELRQGHRGRTTTIVDSTHQCPGGEQFTCNIPAHQTDIYASTEIPTTEIWHECQVPRTERKMTRQYIQENNTTKPDGSTHQTESSPKSLSL